MQKGYSTMNNPTSPAIINSISAPTNIWYDDCSDISNWVVTNSRHLGLNGQYLMIQMKFLQLMYLLSLQLQLLMDTCL